MTIWRGLAGMLTGVVIGLASAAASALTIDLNPTSAFFGPTYSQGGFTFTNIGAGVPTTAYGNWILQGLPLNNANGTNPTIYQNWSGTVNRITSDNGLPFNFRSIALADVFNGGIGGNVLFTFFHTDGSSNSQIVTLANILGLQYFNFAENDVTKVEFQALTTRDRWLQFDFVGVSPVPLPAALPLLAGGLAALGIYGRRRRNRAARSA